MTAYISVNDSGIGSRIKCLISVMILSENNHFVYWPKNGYSRASFGKLFDNKIEVKKIPFTNIYYRNFYFFFKPPFRSLPFFYLKKECNLPKNFSSPLYDEKKNYWYRINNGISIDYQYHKIPAYIKKEYLKTVKKIKFNKKIISTVKKFYDRYFDDEMIGFQVRTWVDDPRRKNMYNINAFIEILKKISKEKKIYITTDNLSVLEDLRKNIDNQIISFPNIDFEKNKKFNTVSSYLSANDDFNVIVELLLLSKCSTIYGSYLSNFPEVAWWLGDCKARVEILNKPIKKDYEEIFNLSC